MNTPDTAQPSATALADKLHQACALLALPARMAEQLAARPGPTPMLPADAVQGYLSQLCGLLEDALEIAVQLEADGPHQPDGMAGLVAVINALPNALVELEIDGTVVRKTTLSVLQALLKALPQ